MTSTSKPAAPAALRPGDHRLLKRLTPAEERTLRRLYPEIEDAAGALKPGKRPTKKRKEQGAASR
jgi:hypothetical protein